MQLKIENLTKAFNGQIVLNNISLELDDIHSLVIIGPSGGGKSTLLRILAGLEYLDQGTIVLNNHVVRFNEKQLREYRKSIGVVFQSYNLFPHLTALENITLPLEKVHHIAREKAYEISITLLKRFKMSAHVQKFPSQLSGGQKQRLAIIRAVAINPNVLMLDEPTSALDPEFTADVLDIIEELKQEKRDFVLVTHEMGFAKKAADYVLFIDNGKIMEMGTRTKIFHHPETANLKNFLAKILKY